jgi:fatty-acyl-CoA synthase
MDARGFVRVTGRLKEMIIRGGENLFPAEIENVLITHPGIAEAAVVGVPDAKWGEIAVCFLRARDGAALEKAELVRHVRAELAAPKTPACWIVVDAFPVTASGKIQKFVLRDRFVAGEFDALTL